MTSTESNRLQFFTGWRHPLKKRAKAEKAKSERDQKYVFFGLIHCVVSMPIGADGPIRSLYVKSVALNPMNQTLVPGSMVQPQLFGVWFASRDLGITLCTSTYQLELPRSVVITSRMSLPTSAVWSSRKAYMSNAVSPLTLSVYFQPSIDPSHP